MRDDASIVPYKWFASFVAISKVSPRQDEGIPPYRTISMFAAHNKTFCTPYQCSFLVYIFRGTLSLPALFPPRMFHVEHSGGKKRRKRQCAPKYINKKTALVRRAECFIMRCKHRNCPVGRDALILPRRNLADCNKRCKPFVGDDACIVPHVGPCLIPPPQTPLPA